jgi:hypothetical protein
VVPRLAPVALTLSIVVEVSCLARSVFTCATDDECRTDHEEGICQDDGFCSFPDDECESGQRYGAHAGEGKGSTCVPLEDAATTTETATSSPETSSTSTADSTTEATGETATGETGLGSTDTGDTTDPGDTGATGTTSTDGTSTGAAPEPVYPPCDLSSDPECPQDFDGCSSYSSEDGSGTHCTYSCTNADQCPMPESGTATMTCGASLCRISCGGAATCPDGMQCIDTQWGMRCIWPDP